MASLLFSRVLGALVAGAIALARPAAATRQMLWSVALAAAGFAPVAILAVMLLRGATAPPAPPIAIHAVRQSAAETGPHAGTPVSVSATAPERAALILKCVHYFGADRGA